jgi:hypothetical protein
MLFLRKLSILSALITIFVLQACTYSETTKPNQKKKFSKEDRIDLAIEHEFLMTRDPALNRVPRERLFEAQEYLARLAATSRGNNTNVLTWQERGPNNVAGRTRAMFIDRQDPSGNTIFAGGVGGGVWKCTNFKTSPTWTVLADRMEKMSNIAVTALAQDPSTPSVIYAGTGEGWFNTDAIQGNGIFKSSDGGNNWSQLASTDSTGRKGDFEFVQDLIVNGTGMVFAATRSARFCNNGGIFRSINGGTSWTRVIGDLRGSVCDSAYNYLGADLELASNGDVYATTGFGSTAINRRGRIFRSAASNGVNIGGTGTWQEITPPGVWERIEIAISPSDPRVIYALLEENNKIGGIRRSRDFGATWETINPPGFCDAGTTEPDFTRGQAWYDLIVQVDPNNPETVIIGGIDLLKSTNGGASWNQITQWIFGVGARCGTLPFVHADQHNILFYPSSSNEVIVSNDGGIYYSSNGGTSWVERNNNYNITQFYSIDLHPTNLSYLLGGTQDNGTQRFTNPGLNSTTRVVGGDGAFAHIDQTDGQIQVASAPFNEYYYSRNGGASWAAVNNDNEEGFFINPTDYDDALDRVYTSNGGNSGTSIGNKIGIITNLNGTGTPTFNDVNLPELGGRLISAIKVDPTVTAGGTAWIAGVRTNVAPLSAPLLLKLTNLGTLTPTVVATSTVPAPSGAYVSSIDIDPANANHLLITLSNYGIVSVYESLNGGTSWNNIEGNLPDMPVRWGIFLPTKASVNGTTGGGILLGTELGVWYTSQTSGTSTVWTAQNENLPNTRIDMLKFRLTDLQLAAATHGRGVFTTTLTSLGGPVVTPTTGFISYISSNKNRIFIKAGNQNITKVRVMLYDMLGRLVRSRDVNYADQTFDISYLPSGMYIVKIVGSNDEQFIQKIVK